MDLSWKFRRELESANNQLNLLAIAGRTTMEAPQIDVNRHGLLRNIGRRVWWLIRPTGKLVAIVVLVSVLGLEENTRRTPSEPMRAVIAVQGKEKRLFAVTHAGRGRID